MFGSGGRPALACVEKRDPSPGSSQCKCDICSQVQKASYVLYDLWYYPQDKHVEPIIDAAISAVWEAKDKLNHLHRPECYKHSWECHLKDLEDEESGRTPDTSGKWPDDEPLTKGLDAFGETSMVGLSSSISISHFANYNSASLQLAVSRNPEVHGLRSLPRSRTALRRSSNLFPMSVEQNGLYPPNMPEKSQQPQRLP